MQKPKIGIYWAASCGGCDVSLLEIDEQILEVAAHAEFVFWPCAIDTKYADLRQFADGSIDVLLFNGAIRTQENREMAQLLRAKSRILVAYGSCAQMGGVIGMANLSTREQIFHDVFGERHNWPHERSYVDDHGLVLPTFLDTLTPLSAVVPVDYTIPGCPPPRSMISKFLTTLLQGTLPERGAVFASDKNLCEECPRERKHLRINRIYRPHEIDPDPEICLLDQGIICMGPATRGGCDAACPQANMPCTGCAGPTAGVDDQGAAMLNTLASLIGPEDESESSIQAEDEIMSEIVDLMGTFYRFGLATSVFKGALRERKT